MSLGIIRAQIVRVASGDQRQSHAVGQVDRAGRTVFLQLQAVVLNFEIEAVAKDLCVPLDQSLRIILAIAKDQG